MSDEVGLWGGVGVPSTRSVYVGPFPPPTHGQAIVTAALATRLQSEGIELIVVDVAGRPGIAPKLFAHAKACFQILRRSECCYISVNSNAGMYISALLGFFARLSRKIVIFHHHAYDQARKRKFSMASLCALGGSGAIHLVLGPTMGRDLMLANPDAKRVHILNNAGFVSRDGGERSSFERKSEIVFGHLSNLTREKGVGTVVDTVIKLRNRGFDVRLILAGPISDNFAADQISLARERLGRAFEYRGPIYGDDKFSYFAEIDIFLFPSLYVHEAAPMVILEAMSAGVQSIAFRTGGIADLVGADGGAVVAQGEDFYQASERSGTFSRSESRKSANRQFLALNLEHECQAAELVDIIKGNYQTRHFYHRVVIEQ